MVCLMVGDDDDDDDDAGVASRTDRDNHRAGDTGGKVAAQPPTGAIKVGKQGNW